MQTVNLRGVRGDEFYAALPLRRPTGPALTPGEPPPSRPLTTAEAMNLIDAYPVIRMQVRLDGQVMCTLTRADGELGIELDYPQPDGTSAPTLLIQGPHTKMVTALWGTYDVQFSTADGRPHTPFGGDFVLDEDVTDAPA